MLIFALFAALALCATKPTWPDKFYCTGIFSVAEANVSMPFILNWDEPNHRENLMYYNSSMDYTIWDNDAYYYVFVKKDHQECTTYPSIIAKNMELTPMLPDLTDYTYEGEAEINGAVVDKWVLESTEGDASTNCARNNYYTMYVDPDTQHPVRFHIHGYNTIYSSHYDIYQFDYFNFTEDYNERTAYEAPSICDNPFNDGAEHFDRQASLFQSLMRPNRQFRKYTEDFDKAYSSETEREYRQRIFRQNMDRINELNLKHSTWKAAPNRFADMTYEEIQASFMGYRHSEDRPTPPHFTAAPSAAELEAVPEALDWRVHEGVTGRVKDQCACGSCWTFGAVGTLEGRYAVANNDAVHTYFSEQFIVDCFWDSSDMGCDGGNSDRALAWLVNHMDGVPTESDYQYLGVDSYCYEERIDEAYKLPSWGSVESRSVDALKVALQDGPVAVAICVPESMVWYASGIYSDDECGSREIDLGHAVTCEGYGVDAENGEYWIIKNSWSTQWGKDGYIYISTEDNMCGVATDASYAIY